MNHLQLERSDCRVSDWCETLSSTFAKCNFEPVTRKHPSMFPISSIPWYPSKDKMATWGSLLGFPRKEMICDLHLAKPRLIPCAMEWFGLEREREREQISKHCPVRKPKKITQRLPISLPLESTPWQHGRVCGLVVIRWHCRGAFSGHGFDFGIFKRSMVKPKYCFQGVEGETDVIY